MYTPQSAAEVSTPENSLLLTGTGQSTDSVKKLWKKL
jgi:hypothetical protein